MSYHKGERVRITARIPIALHQELERAAKRVRMDLNSYITYLLLNAFR